MYIIKDTKNKKRAMRDSKVLDEVCFRPADEKQRLIVESFSIKNGFVALGYKGRTAFIEVVQTHIDSLKGYRQQERLAMFWLGRMHNAEMNAQLAKLLETLKNKP